ncbi:MAG: glycoside hydrolase family 1 protein [Firmicutes bacterium]|nr:glycoside hydrolase family 1 protein [Bacillota bacterium]
MTRAGFPKDFLWGSASAAYQVEGAHSADGKGESIWDRWVRMPGKTYKGTTGDVAADHYHRYLEDIQLMKELGLKSYRFSIAWTRIFPNGTGEVNQAGLEFYKNLVDELVSSGIEPIVTLYHWDLPQALQDKYGGWQSREIIKDFARYAETCFVALGDKVKYWIVLNEPNIFTQLGYLLALHPPGMSCLREYLHTYHITALTHATVVKLFKERRYPGYIGSSIAFTPGYAASDSVEDRKALANYYATTCWWLLDIYYRGGYPDRGVDYFSQLGVMPAVTEDDNAVLQEGARLADFIGINYYQTAMIAHNPLDGVSLGSLNTTGKKGTQAESGVPGLYKQVFNPNIEYTDWDWAIDSDGLRYGMVQLKDRYNLPVLISENGLGAFDKAENGAIRDPYRIDYLAKHIAACHAALVEGVELWGYCTWSFTDLFSWLNGFQKRYGLVYVDYEGGSLKRIKKDSFYWYKQVIAANGANCMESQCTGGV